MQKYKKAAINIAILTIILSTGMINSYPAIANIDSDIDLDGQDLARYSESKKEKIENTFEDNDYQAWKKIVGRENRARRIINETDFQRFVAARAAARRGQYDEAIRITEELKKKVKEKLG